MKNSQTTMTKICCSALLMTCWLGLSDSPAQADVIVLDLGVTDTVAIGGQVEWQLSVTVSDYQTPANNFGIARVVATLLDSGGNMLTPGMIGAPFQDYTFVSGGMPAVNVSALLDITALAFSQNNATVEAADPVLLSGSNPGPLLLASGSFTAETEGTFNLTVVAGSSANEFFTAAGSGNSQAFVTGFNSNSYTVTAVPEPNSWWALCLFCTATFRRRKV